MSSLNINLIHYLLPYKALIKVYNEWNDLENNGTPHAVPFFIMAGYSK